jgi:hypothetical protein
MHEKEFEVARLDLEEGFDVDLSLLRLFNNVV